MFSVNLIKWSKSQSTTGLALLNAGLAISVSIVSGYSIISPYDVDFEVATMLTPAGIIKNYWLNETVLTPYYSQAPQRTGVFDDVGLFVLVGFLVLSSLFLMKKLRVR